MGSCTAAGFCRSDLKTVLGELSDRDNDLRQRLAAAWKRGVTSGTEGRLRDGLEQILQPRHEELQRWSDFGKDTVTVEEITARVALRSMRWRRRRAVRCFIGAKPSRRRHRVPTAPRRSKPLSRNGTRHVAPATPRCERDVARQERDGLLAIREALAVERDLIVVARDTALAARDAAFTARDEALTRGDRALRERYPRESTVMQRSRRARRSSPIARRPWPVATAGFHDRERHHPPGRRLAAADRRWRQRNVALSRADAALVERTPRWRHATPHWPSATTPVRPVTWRQPSGDKALEVRTDIVADAATTNRDLSDLREFYDSRITDLASAQSLSHGHYDIASRRAASQQSIALMDFLQRTHRGAGQGLRPSLAAAALLPDGLHALDVGCGVGRQMVPLAEAGIHVDGVDISPRMIELARGDARLAGSQFFVGSGRDCGDAPAGAYDLVYSSWSFARSVRVALRRALLQSMARALRSGGVIFVEMRLFPKASRDVVPPHVPWSAEWTGALTAGHADVEITPDELHLVYQDFAAFFGDVRLQIVDVPVESRHRLPPQLLVSGAVNGTLGERITPWPSRQKRDARGCRHTDTSSACRRRSR